MRPFSLPFFQAFFFTAFFPIGLVWSLLGLGFAPHPKPADPVTLESVLKKMDETAASFRSTEAQFEWDRYEKVIDEVDDIEFGTIYYRRSDKDIEMMADITKPDKKYVLFKEGKVSMYMPKPDQVTVWDLGKSSADFESYLDLGFGGSGQDLMKSFDVTFLGPQTVAGVPTAELQLIPKSVKLRNNIAKILLWIDLDKGISVQQQFFEPQGDYRLTKYSSIELNGKKIPDAVFKLKTTSKTQTISPRG
jgi:outer membrane lipoprotein-sorting protein